MSSYTIKGIVRRIGDTAQVTDRMTKRVIVLETSENPKYPQVHEIEATGDRCSLLDGIAVGSTATVEFNLRGREWTSPRGEVRVFNTLSLWKIDAPRVAAPVAPPAQAGFDDDIPF